MIIETSKFLQFRRKNEIYLVECLNQKKIFKISKPALDIIYFFKTPGTIKNLSKSLTTTYNITDLLVFCENLIELNILIKSDNKEYKKQVNTAKKLSYGGWDKDYKFHIFTNDYVFGDYSENGKGREKSRVLMKKYSDIKKDNNRYKSFKKILSSKTLKKPGEIDINSDISFLDALSLVNCKMSETNLTRWKGAPLIRRSSPSGGARHPIETYIVIKNRFEGLETGIYHLNFGEFKLDKITNEASNIDCDIKLIFSSLPLRNMYRYRESRTMRSIHMDCGHLLENNAQLLSSIGFKCTMAFENEDEAFSNLGIDSFFETYMVTLKVNYEQ
ncbi:SagB/ThcOx family dehydrogenase [Aliivibrio fischeri]|uniref:Nitroreductase domain-containing protein n=1 Tax=Aliivibrio fischeri TaxID=668 RepID=A0A844NXP3_ALIFS|nr:SagB/ThcOx family dehydrogenase [Aliivibrio fischeri]MUK47875.1 hypothetical protein [Aliivibrio fischeri]